MFKRIFVDVIQHLKERDSERETETKRINNISVYSV